MGDMLAPRASKRTLDPALSSSRVRTSKLAESVPVLVMEIYNFFNRAFVGLERVAIARN